MPRSGKKFSQQFLPMNESPFLISCFTNVFSLIYLHYFLLFTCKARTLGLEYAP